MDCPTTDVGQIYAMAMAFAMALVWIFIWLLFSKIAASKDK